MRCEDFPCCGHKIGECPSGETKNCPECGQLFQPCSLGEEYCLACGSRPFGGDEMDKDYQDEMNDNEREY